MEKVNYKKEEAEPTPGGGVIQRSSCRAHRFCFDIHYTYFSNIRQRNPNKKTDSSSTATTTLSPGDMLEGSADQILPWIVKVVNKGFDLAYKCFCDDVNC